jgi:hypothetical protein
MVQRAAASMSESCITVGTTTRINVNPLTLNNSVNSSMIRSFPPMKISSRLDSGDMAARTRRKTALRPFIVPVMHNLLEHVEIAAAGYLREE